MSGICSRNQHHQPGCELCETSLASSPCSRFEWEGDLEDDCSLRAGEWLAHAECISSIRCGDQSGERIPDDSFDADIWYLSVYRGTDLVFHSQETGGMILEAAMARAIAEAIIGANDQVLAPAESTQTLSDD